MRLAIAILSGVGLGIVIHIVVILALPNLAERDLWHRLETMTTPEQLVILDDVEPGAANPLELDPELLYGVCRLSLDEGPGVVNGALPHSFWSVAVFGEDGHVIYSTTSRAGTGRAIDLGIFNPPQMRLLAEQRFEIEEGLLIVEAPDDNVIVVIRLAPPHPSARDRYRDALSRLRCLTIR